MQEIERNSYIEAIKMAAGSVQYKNLSVKTTMIKAAEQLYWYYEKLKDMRYLETAMLHMQAYLEMGFAYDEGAEVFERILEGLGTTREIQFPDKFYASKKIKLNKSRVRSMLRRWPASSRQGMKIGEVVEDIITKVRTKETGIFGYECAATGDFYELVVGEEETFFHDIRSGIFYTFED
ncbi:hypothetical protein BRYFOR_06679 [Marvinbryantia formatexigens DSM 14469]|uniref:Uncharacterized protein n=1 Tax=Marvinbryantia formatexigens DSM 14469 TaxID=478749 RepID=C6LD21_9FIRM|nr:hypothetical protein [Marvinbryantia formatexigens]EET61504.1 hypothetical protein BRYFOR_06679 [Marvinbryantia formatexigens DSM 14469]UWO26160.1 hypothetical protein NQ534_06755 [Marvinbryantia formatexigens DSM 14469]SDF92918.1 hypothetical protein SAMN05660368_01614 [Marvinbryantia formatexigens]